MFCYPLTFLKNFQPPEFFLLLLGNSSLHCLSQEGVTSPTKEPKIIPNIHYCSNNSLLEEGTCFHLFCFFSPLIKSNNESKGIVQYHQV